MSPTERRINPESGRIEEREQPGGLQQIVENIVGYEDGWKPVDYSDEDDD